MKLRSNRSVLVRLVAAFGCLLGGVLALSLEPTNSNAACSDYSQGMKWLHTSASEAGDYRRVDADGGYLVVAGNLDEELSPPFYVIYDVTDPQIPVELASDLVPGVEVTEVAVIGSHFAVAADIVQLLPFTGPGGVVVPGLNGVLRFTWEGDYLYASTFGGLVVVDISDPEIPSIVGTLNTLGPTDAELVVLGGYLYYVDGDLKIVDVADPMSPALAATIPTGVLSHLATDGTFVYAGREVSLEVYDASVPTAPQLVASLSDPGGNDVGSMEVVGDVLYYGRRLTAVSIADPVHPQVLGNSAFAAQDIAVAGGVAFVASDYVGVVGIDVASLTSPYESEEVVDTGNIRDLEYESDRLFTVGGSLFRVFDATPLAETASIDFFGPVYALEVSGDLGFVASDGPGWPIDLTNPDVPVAYPSFSIPFQIKATASSGSLFFLLATSEFVILDLSDPGSPVERSSTPVSVPIDLSLDGSLCVVTTGSGATLYDVANPDVPALASSIAEPIRGVFLNGGYLYAAVSGGGLRTYDVSTPSSPVLVSEEPCPAIADHIVSDGSFLYASSGEGVLAFALSDPASPSLIGDEAASTAPLVATPQGIVTAGGGALHRLPPECATSSADPVAVLSDLQLTVSPNPFFRATSIGLAGEIEGDAQVVVTDAAGRLVRTLFSGRLGGGAHEWLWNGESDLGRSLPAGVYYVRADRNGVTETARVVQLR